MSLYTCNTRADCLYLHKLSNLLVRELRIDCRQQKQQSSKFRVFMLVHALAVYLAATIHWLACGMERCILHCICVLSCSYAVKSKHNHYLVHCRYTLRFASMKTHLCVDYLWMWLCVRSVYVVWLAFEWCVEHLVLPMHMYSYTHVDSYSLFEGVLSLHDVLCCIHCNETCQSSTTVAINYIGCGCVCYIWQRLHVVVAAIAVLFKIMHCTVVHAYCWWCCCSCSHIHVCFRRHARVIGKKGEAYS